MCVRIWAEAYFPWGKAIVTTQPAWSLARTMRLPTHPCQSAGGSVLSRSGQVRTFDISLISQVPSPAALTLLEPHGATGPGLAPGGKMPLTELQRPLLPAPRIADPSCFALTVSDHLLTMVYYLLSAAKALGVGKTTEDSLVSASKSSQANGVWLIEYALDN